MHIIDFMIERVDFSLISTRAESGLIYMKRLNIPVIQVLLIQQSLVFERDLLKLSEDFAEAIAIFRVIIEKCLTIARL